FNVSDGRRSHMRVAFLKPPIGGILGLEMLTFVEPLGLICVAASLERDGHDCRVIDLRLEGEDQGLAACRRFAPDVVGLQCNFTTERRRALRLAHKVRAALPDAYIVIGGHDASREPDWFDDPVFDAVAVGDGEAVMPPLVAALAQGTDPAGVPGLVVRQGSDWIATGAQPPRGDLD